MTTIYKIIMGIIAGIAIAGWLFFGVQGCQKNKVIATLTSERDNCLHAPIHSDTVIIHDTIYSDRWHTPKPVPVPFAIHDTIPAKYCEQSYSDNYPFIKGALTGNIKYDIDVKDCRVNIRFSQIALPTEQITNTKTVDTCFLKKPEYYPKSHLFIYGGITLNNIKTFPGIQAGMGWTIKDRVAVMPGMLYNTDNKLYGQISIGIYLK